MKAIQDKIDALEKAIASPATPEPQRVVMKERLAVLEEQLKKSINAEQNGIRNKAIVLQKVFKASNPQNAFSNTADGGYANIESEELSQNGTEIHIKISGESPLVDADDEKRLRDQVTKLNGKTEKIEVAGNPINVTYTDVKVNVKESAVTGSFTLKLSDTIKK